jgi:hypothetical protein
MMQGVQFEEIWKAFNTGYTKRSLEQMLKTRLNIQLENIVADAPMRDMVFDLLSQSEREGWTTDLVREGYLYNPRNADLLKIYEKYGLGVRVDAQVAGVHDPTARSITNGLERTIRERLPLFDFGVFRERMAQVERCVCRVEIDGNAAGTGFLVGPDAILTNYHVLQSILKNAELSTKVSFRFGYEVLANGSRVEGIAVGLRAVDWKLDASPQSAAELTQRTQNPPPTADELDFALVRLAKPIGLEPSAAKGSIEAPRRGWLPIPATPAIFLPKMPLIIAQHPDGKPLKLAIDTEAVIGLNVAGNRVRYAINTGAGSSGSPVFDFDWNLVALHHLGDPAYDTPPAYNQGIPIAAILARLQRPGNEAALAALGENQN